ncbi:MAG: hypothetical protein K1X52_04520 [Pyrinomonadaceae bacterium]|nr:hypothetical protein [Pyrinomonadaceae bacterium]
MKGKILNGLLILTSLVGYLEWGAGNSTFLFKAEYEVLRKLFSDPLSAVHPFTLIPLLGQVLLLVTLFQKRPSPVLTLLGITGLFLLLGLICFIGMISLNAKIFGSTLPFIAISAVTIFTLWKTRKTRENLAVE